MASTIDPEQLASQKMEYDGKLQRLKEQARQADEALERLREEKKTADAEALRERAAHAQEMKKFAARMEAVERGAGRPAPPQRAAPEPWDGLDDDDAAPPASMPRVPVRTVIPQDRPRAAPREHPEEHLRRQAEPEMVESDGGGGEDDEPLFLGGDVFMDPMRWETMGIADLFEMRHFMEETFTVGAAPFERNEIKATIKALLLMARAVMNGAIAPRVMNECAQPLLLRLHMRDLRNQGVDARGLDAVASAGTNARPLWIRRLDQAAAETLKLQQQSSFRVRGGDWSRARGGGRGAQGGRGNEAPKAPTTPPVPKQRGR